MSKHAFRKRALGPFFFVFLMSKLPLAFIAGVKLRSLDDKGSSTSLRYRWLNKNPFRSLYFAAMHMAAELSTGLLLFQHITKQNHFSMLLIETNAKYHKKAVGQILFTCMKGQQVDAFIDKMLKTENGATITLPVEATNENGELVAEFYYTWSCKKKG